MYTPYCETCCPLCGKFVSGTLPLNKAITIGHFAYIATRSCKKLNANLVN